MGRKIIPAWIAKWNASNKKQMEIIAKFQRATRPARDMEPCYQYHGDNWKDSSHP
jgi:hypothetical protein